MLRVQGSGLKGREASIPLFFCRLTSSLGRKTMTSNELEPILPRQLWDMGSFLGSTLGTILNHKRDSYVHC